MTGRVWYLSRAGGLKAAKKATLPYLDLPHSQNPEGPSTQELGTWVLVIVIIVQVFGKYMIIRYLDPEGNNSLQPRNAGYIS